MAILKNPHSKSWKFTSNLTGRKYLVPGNGTVNMEDIDAMFFFAYKLRNDINDVDIRGVFLPRLREVGVEMTEEEWKALSFEAVGSIGVKEEIKPKEPKENDK